MSANNNSGAGKGLPLARKRTDRRSSILKPSKSEALSSSILTDKRGQMEKRRVSFNQNILVKEFAKQKEKKQNDSVESSGSETSATNLSKVYETQANESFFQISTPTIGAKKRRITGLPDRLSIIPQLYKPDLEDDLEFEPYAEESPGKGAIIEPPQQQPFVGAVVSDKENQEQILEPEPPVQQQVATVPPAITTCNPDQFLQASSATINESEDMILTLGATASSQLQLANESNTDLPVGGPGDTTQEQQVLQDKPTISVSKPEALHQEGPVPDSSIQPIQEKHHISVPSHKPMDEQQPTSGFSFESPLPSMDYKNMATPVQISPLSIPSTYNAGGNDGSYCASDSSLDVTCHDKSMFSHAGTNFSGEMSITYDDSNIFEVSGGDCDTKGASEAMQQHVFPPTSTSHLSIPTDNVSLNRVEQDNPPHTSIVHAPVTVSASVHVESLSQNLPPSTQNIKTFPQTLETLPPSSYSTASQPVVSVPVASDISQSETLTQSVCIPIENHAPLPSTSHIVPPPDSERDAPVTSASVAPTYSNLHGHSFKAGVDSKSGSTTSGEKTSKLPAALSLIPDVESHAAPTFTTDASADTSQSYAKIHNIDVQVPAEPPALLAAPDQSFTHPDNKLNISYPLPPPLEAVTPPNDNNKSCSTQNRNIEKIPALPPLPKSPLCISHTANMSSMESTSNKSMQRQLPLPFASTSTSVPNIEEQAEPLIGSNIEKEPFNTSIVPPSLHATEKQASPPSTPVAAPSDSLASTSTHQVESSVVTAHSEVADSIIHHSFNVSAGQKHPSSSSTLAVSKKLAVTPRSGRTVSGLKSPFMPDYTGPNSYVQQRTGSLKKSKDQQLSSSPKIQRKTSEPLSKSMQLRSMDPITPSKQQKQQMSVDPIPPSIQHGQRSMESSYQREQVSRPSTAASLNKTGASDTKSTSTFIVQPAAAVHAQPDEEEEEASDRTFVIHSSLHQAQLELDNTVILEPKDNWINEVSEIDFVENTPASNTPVPRRYLTRSASKAASPGPTSASKIPKLTPRRLRAQSASKASKARLERIAAGLAALQDKTPTGRKFDESLDIRTPEILVLEETVLNQTTVLDGDDGLDSTMASYTSTGRDFLKRIVVAANADETINLVKEYEEQERKREEERKKKEEIATLEEERKREEERLEVEQKNQEEKKRLEEERKRLEELALLEEERKKREENERLQQEQLRLEEEERQRLEEERKRQEEELQQLEEQRRREEEERKKREENERQEQEQLRLEEEMKRQEEERQQLEEQRKREEEERRRQEILNERIEQERKRRREEENRRQEESKLEKGDEHQAEDTDNEKSKKDKCAAVSEESKLTEQNSPSILLIDVLRRVERKVKQIFDMINLRLMDDGPRHKKSLKHLHGVAYSSVLVIRCKLNYARSCGLQSPYCNIVIPDTAPGLFPNGNDGSGSMEKKDEWVENLLKVMNYYINVLMRKSIKESFEEYYGWKASFWCNEYAEITFQKKNIKLRLNLSTKGILPDRPPAILRCQKIESIHFSSLTDDVSVEHLQTHNFKHSSSISDIPMMIQEVLQI